MTEDEAREEAQRRVPRETFEALKKYASILREAACSQNLVSRATLETLWSRHILDSIQLHPLVRGNVVDVGSGAGLPGLVLAVLGSRVTLVEPRRLRATFLRYCIEELRLSATLHAVPAAAVKAPFDTITARAVAPLIALLEMTWHLGGLTGRWVLPKGRSVHEELEVARSAWHGCFELVPSITDPLAMIVVADQLKPKASR